MTQVSDTKKCPFCAYDRTKVERYSFVPDAIVFEYRVICLNCGACGPNDLSEKQAVLGWNMRREIHPSIGGSSGDSE